MQSSHPIHVAVFQLHAQLVIAPLVVMAMATAAVSGWTLLGVSPYHFPVGAITAGRELVPPAHWETRPRVNKRSPDANRGYGYRHRRRYGGGGLSGLLSGFNRYCTIDYIRIRADNL